MAAAKAAAPCCARTEAEPLDSRSAVSGVLALERDDEIDDPTPCWGASSRRACRSYRASRSSPRVDLDELPSWVLWRSDDNGNQFEMERFRSYAKAELHERIYTNRGHKQLYWIRPA